MAPATRKKKALLIGINYESPPDGGYATVKAMKKLLIKHFGYQEDRICVLLDDGDHKLPTRENILGETKKLVDGARPADRLFFYYSGHIAQKSGEDEDTILPLDYRTAGGIGAQDIHNQYKRLPRGCSLTAIFDCCHSAIPRDLWRVNGMRETRARIMGEKSLSNSQCRNAEGHEPPTDFPLSSPDKVPVIPDIKRANRCHSSDLKLDIAQKFDRNDDYLAVTEAELQKARSRWLQITRQLKTAVFAGGAGELFSGSPWMETPCDEETALLNALEACNYTASLFPISTLFSQTCEILEVALGAMRNRNRWRQQIFHLAREVTSLVQLVVLDESSIIALNEKSGARLSPSLGYDDAGFDRLSAVSTLLRNVHDFLERMNKRGFLASFFFASDDQVTYDSLCQRLHSVYERICETRTSEKQSVRDAVLVMGDLDALLKRLKQSSHILACTSVALSFISECKKSGFDHLSWKLLGATMKDITAFPSPSSPSYATSVAQMSLHHNRTLFDEPSLSSLISTFHEPLRRVMDMAANEARQKVVMTSIYMWADDTCILAGPLLWRAGTVGS